MEQKPEGSREGRKSTVGRDNNTCKCPTAGVSLTCVVGEREPQGKYKRRHQRATGWQDTGQIVEGHLKDRLRMPGLDSEMGQPWRVNFVLFCLQLMS